MAPQLKPLVLPKDLSYEFRTHLGQGSLSPITTAVGTQHLLLAFTGRHSHTRGGGERHRERRRERDRDRETDTQRHRKMETDTETLFLEYKFSNVT